MLERAVGSNYSLSNYFVIGHNLYKNRKKNDGDVALKRGAENDGCLWCMVLHAVFLIENDDTFYEALSWFIEGAIRGNTFCIEVLVDNYRKFHGDKQFYFCGLINF